MQYKQDNISTLGGMAKVYTDNIYDCPPWIDLENWKDYRSRYESASKGNPDLIQLDIELADNCNYRCIECPISDDLKRKINYLSEDQALSIISDFRLQGGRALKLNYINEPLLYAESILRIAEKSKEMGILDIYFATNASLLNEKNARSIIQSNSISRIQVSLDAATEETYQKVRKGGKLQVVEENINRFIRLREHYQTSWPRLRVNFLTLPENKSEADKFVEKWEGKVDGIAIQSSVLKPNTTRTDKEQFTKERSHFCPNPFRQIVCRADGSLLPCCSFWGTQLELGNLNKDTIKDLWESKKMIDLQKTFLSSKEPLKDICVNCLRSCNPDES